LCRVRSAAALAMPGLRVRERAHRQVLRRLRQACRRSRCSGSASPAPTSLGYRGTPPTHGNVLRFGRLDSAARDAQRPGDLAVAGATFVFEPQDLAYSIDETIPLVERAIRLSPRDPFALGTWYQTIGLVHLLQSRTDEAIVWSEKARNHSPALSINHAQLASAYALNGETERGAAELAEAQRLSPDDRYSSLARLRAFYNFDVPKIRALRDATYFAGLRKAGMPEE